MAMVHDFYPHDHLSIARPVVDYKDCFIPTHGITEVIDLHFQEGRDINNPNDIYTEIFLEWTNYFTTMECIHFICSGEVVSVGGNRTLFYQYQILIGWHSMEHLVWWRCQPQYDDFVKTCDMWSIRPHSPYTFVNASSRPLVFPPEAYDLVFEVTTFYDVAPQAVPTDSKAANLECYLRKVIQDVHGPWDGSYGHILEPLERSEGDGEGPCMLMISPYHSLTRYDTFVTTPTYNSSLPYLIWGSKEYETHLTWFDLRYKNKRFYPDPEPRTRSA